MRTTRLLPVSPSMHCAGGVSAPGGVCSGGVSAWGVSAQWGCLLQAVSALGGCLLWGCLLRGCLLWGVSVPGGVGCLFPGGLLLGAVSQHAMGQSSPPVDKILYTRYWKYYHTLLKILPCPNFVAGGNYINRMIPEVYNVSLTITPLSFVKTYRLHFFLLPDVDLNSRLTAEQKAIGRAFQTLVEDNLIWFVI